MERKFRSACLAETKRSSTGSGCGPGRMLRTNVTLGAVGVVGAVGAAVAVAVGETAEAAVGGNDIVSEWIAFCNNCACKNA